MAVWLLKTEPTVYSITDLQRDQKTVWDGVANNLALIHIRAMKKDDTAVIYHTGDEKAAAGLAKISSAPYPDPHANNPKLVVVDLTFDRKFPSPVTLNQVKSDPRFVGWDLLRIGRLSVVPTSDAQLQALLSLVKV